MEKLGVLGFVLMENVGRGCVDVLCCEVIFEFVLIFCGVGNNVGDGFVMVCYLVIWGVEVMCVIFVFVNLLFSDVGYNFVIVKKVVCISWYYLELLLVV